MIKFIEAGGTVTPEPVSFAEIQRALDEKLPSILNLDVGPMWALPDKEAGHFVVPVDIRGEETIVLNDPNRKYGGVVKYPIESVIHACYIWRSSCLFIEPKRA